MARGQVIASSGTLAGLGFGAATLIATVGKQPTSNPWFVVSTVVGVGGTVAFVGACIAGVANWAAGLVHALRPPRRLVTNRWRYTTDGALPELRPLNQLIQVRLPGSDYMKPPDQQPPCVRLVVMTACTAIHPDTDEAGLRERFGRFLEQSPVMSVVRSLTYVDPADWWFRWAGGYGGLDAVLAPAEGADGVGARLLLPYAVQANWRDHRYAVLILHIVPRNRDDEPAAQVAPETWAARIGGALALPHALADFLKRDLARRVTGEPQAVLGVRMQARQMTELVDVTGKRLLPGGRVTSEGWGYFVGDRDGEPPAGAAERMTRHMLNYAFGREA